jgi:hypothetical protein
MYALYKKLKGCRQISRIIGEDVDGKDINICNYWDTVENKILVNHNSEYIYFDNIYVTANNILESFGITYREDNIIHLFTDMKTEAPNKMLDVPLLETSRQIINTLCGDGIDSDDYDSD